MNMMKLQHNGHSSTRTYEIVLKFTVESGTWDRCGVSGTMWQQKETYILLKRMCVCVWLTKNTLILLGAHISGTHATTATTEMRWNDVGSKQTCEQKWEHNNNNNIAAQLEKFQNVHTHTRMYNHTLVLRCWRRNGLWGTLTYTYAQRTPQSESDSLPAFNGAYECCVTQFSSWKMAQDGRLIRCEGKYPHM